MWFNLILFVTTSLCFISALDHYLLPSRTWYLILLFSSFLWFKERNNCFCCWPSHWSNLHFSFFSSSFHLQLEDMRHNKNIKYSKYATNPRDKWWFIFVTVLPLISIWWLWIDAYYMEWSWCTIELSTHNITKIDLQQGFVQQRWRWWRKQEEGLSIWERQKNMHQSLSRQGSSTVGHLAFVSFIIACIKTIK